MRSLHIVLLVILVTVFSQGLMFYYITESDDAQRQQILEQQAQNAKLQTQLDIVSSQLVQTQELVQNTSQHLQNLLLVESQEREQAISDLTVQLQDQLDVQIAQFAEESSALQEQISTISAQATDFSDIIAEITESVVSVRTNRGQGSGVIVHREGYVVTNYHVVQNAAEIEVINSNSRIFDVELVAFSADLDLALVKIERSGDYPRLLFAKDARVGQRVVAVGNPLGLSFSVSQGIISALNREIDTSGIDYIQHDVSINPGNSGGPIVNTEKRIVGINTLKIGETEGLGFAIPFDEVEDFVDDAIEADQE